MIRVAYNTTVKIGGKEQSLPTNIQGEFPFVVEGEIVKISNVFDDEIVEVNLNDCLIGELPEMEIPNEDYKIEYKGFTIYEGKIGKLVEHFEIFWNDDMETYESDNLGCEGETIEECLEECLAEANELGDRVIDVMHSYENDFQAYDNYTKKDFIEDLRQGNYQLWSQLNFAHIALEDYFAEEGIKLFN